jgi:hypothetical protein
MPIQSVDDITAGLNAITRPRFVNKPSIANMSNAIIASYWRSNGIPVSANTPTSPETCTSTTLGAIEIPDEGSGDIYLMGYAALCSTTGSVYLVDRLSQMGGLNGTLTTAQTVNLGIATPASQGRCNANGIGVLWGLEWYTDTGATAVTATVTYTNQNDQTGRTVAISLAATRRAGMFIPIVPTTAGDYIKSIQTVQLSATTGTAGNFGVTAVQVLDMCGILNVGIAAQTDFVQAGMPKITSDMCLSAMLMCTGTTAGNLMLTLKYARK